MRDEVFVHISLKRCPHWRRALGYVPPPSWLPTVSFLLHFGVNLTASYPNIARSACADVNNSQLSQSVLHQSQNY